MQFIPFLNSLELVYQLAVTGSANLIESNSLLVEQVGSAHQVAGGRQKSVQDDGTLLLGAQAGKKKEE